MRHGCKSLVQVEAGSEADFEQQLKLQTDMAKLKETVTAKLGEAAGKQIQAGEAAGLVMLRTAKITINGTGILIGAARFAG